MQAQDTGSLSQQIAKHIATQIICGDLVEGERIPELGIAEALNVSRGSVREALLLLQRTHLIEIYPRRGAVVSELSIQHVDALFSTLQLLLTAMLRAIMAHDREQYANPWDQLWQHLQQQLPSRHTDQFYDAFFNFFVQQQALIQNSYILQFYCELLPGLRRYYFLTLNTPRGELKDALAKFECLTDAVLSADCAQAIALMMDFCQHLQALVLDSLTRMKQIELAWGKRSRR